jgi:hypothetical protein
MGDYQRQLLKGNLKDNNNIIIADLKNELPLIIHSKDNKWGKIMVFKENEFKPELAPDNALISYEKDDNGETMVVMKYGSIYESN